MLHHRCVEDGDDRIAGELDDRAAFAKDQWHDDAEVAIQDLDRFLRLVPLGERREPGQVGEERRDLGERAAERRLLRVGDQRAHDLRREVLTE